MITVTALPPYNSVFYSPPQGDFLSANVFPEDCNGKFHVLYTRLNIFTQVNTMHNSFLWMFRFGLLNTALLTVFSFVQIPVAEATVKGSRLVINQVLREDPENKIMILVTDMGEGSPGIPSREYKSLISDYIKLLKNFRTNPRVIFGRVDFIQEDEEEVGQIGLLESLNRGLNKRGGNLVFDTMNHDLIYEEEGWVIIRSPKELSTFSNRVFPEFLNRNGVGTVMVIGNTQSEHVGRFVDGTISGGRTVVMDPTLSHIPESAMSSVGGNRLTVEEKREIFENNWSHLQGREDFVVVEPGSPSCFSCFCR